jgi:hypothetical protein
MRQPDMAAVFWKKAAEITAENGVLGLVLPHSLVGAETYKKLRDYIREEVEMDFSLIARLGSAGLFEKAMIIPNVLVGTKKTKAKSHTVLWTDYQQSSVFTALRQLRIYRSNEIPTPIAEKDFSIYENDFLTDRELSDNWKVSSYQQQRLFEKLKGLDIATVGKLFNVKRGVDAGNNAAFILTKDEWLQLPKNEKIYFRPTIMRDSIINGRLNDNLYLFFPYEKRIINSETELLEKLKSYYTLKLEIQKARLKGRKGFEERWWELSRPRSFNNNPKLVSAYFGKAGYFAFDRNGGYLVGQSFAWIPKKKKGELDEKGELDNEQYYFAYLALLHAPLIDQLLEMVSVNIAGGQFDLSKHYIDNMPLPDLSKADPSILESLIIIGKAIHDGHEVNKDKLNQEVANAYGLSLKYFDLKY